MPNFVSIGVIFLIIIVTILHKKPRLQYHEKLNMTLLLDSLDTFKTFFK